VTNVRAHQLWLLILGGGLTRLCIAWAPFEWLLRYVLADDAFYYFTIARNAAQGFGLTFDRIAETNGFHPLWLFILLPIQSLMQDKIVAIHAILSLSAIIDTLTIYLLWVLLREQNVRQNIRLVVCSFYAFPTILFSHAGPLSGLETALNLMVISFYLILYFRILKSDLFQLREAMIFGIVSSLLFLARTDNIVLLGATYIHIGVHYRNQSGPSRYLFASGSTALILVVPWLIWSYVNFGSLVQVSGQSVAFVTRANLDAQGWSAMDFLLQTVRNLASIVRFFPFYLDNTSTMSFIPLLIAIALGGFALSTIRLLRSREAKQAVVMSQYYTSLMPLLVVIVAFVAIHTLRGVYLRGWYYTSLLPFLFLLGGVTTELFVTSTQPKHKLALRRISIVALLPALVVYGESMRRVYTKAIGEIDKYQMVLSMNRVLPEKTTVGSWNAGVYGYFFDRGNIVNLDGLVNNVAYDHIKNRSLGDYCRRVGVTHLVDPVGSFRYWQSYWAKEPTDLLRQGDVIYETPRENVDRKVVLLHLHSR
jgi:hypothetical protein